MFVIRIVSKSELLFCILSKKLTGDDPVKVLNVFEETCKLDVINLSTFCKLKNVEKLFATVLFTIKLC